MIRPLLLSLVVSGLTACASSDLSQPLAVEPISVKVKCPGIPADLVNLSKRKASVTGDDGYVVSLGALQYGHSQNAGLKRALSLYKKCREASVVEMTGVEPA